MEGLYGVGEEVVWGAVSGVGGGVLGHNASRGHMLAAHTGYDA